MILTSTWSDPPDKDVIEVSIFGPGKGESILVHLGHGDWIIVDSCVRGSDGGVPALEYLERMGVDVTSAVHLVVGTHAHDDHVRGLSKIYEACTSAFFVCSAAASATEMRALVALDTLIPEKAGRVRQEYSKIYDIVRQRGMASNVAQMKIAAEQKPIMTPKLRQRGDVSITALSPSDWAVQRSRQTIERAFRVAGSNIRAQPSDPNELAVALWVVAGGKAILLGADLLVGPAGCGWNAVLSTHSVDVRAAVIKVPHHGSVTGHHDTVWEEMLDPKPIALLAPFRGGHKPLPSAEDIGRICQLTPHGFVTTGSDRSSSMSLSREKAALGTLAMNIRDPWGKVGHVRARSRKGDMAWTIDGSVQARALVGNTVQAFSRHTVVTV